jgi:hypothetical protein
MLYDKGKINGALIIAPKGVYKNWLESGNTKPFTRSHRKENRFLQTKPDANDMKMLLKSDEDLHILYYEHRSILY